MENVTFVYNYHASTFESQASGAADFNIAMGGVEIVQSRPGFTDANSENNEGITRYC